MGSVSSINPGVANLLQTLSNIGSPVLQSPAEVSALEKAPSGDIVQLSMEATELEGVNAMFGIPAGSSMDMNSTVATLGDILSGSMGTGSTAPSNANIGFLDPSLLSTASPADQLANYQAAFQGAETQGLFGAGTTSGLTNSLFDVMG